MRVHDVFQKRKNCRKVFVYCIVDDDTNHVKVGVTEALVPRLKAVVAASGRPRLRYHKTCAYPDKRTACMVERHFHRQLQQFRLAGEWFSAMALPILDERFREVYE